MASTKRICLSLDRTDKRQDPHHKQKKEETSNDNRDPFIGLDVCGKIYYCRQSTLMNASPYFNRRFKGDFDASISFIGPQGRTVYFVERPPTTFQYIFEYIVSGSTLTLPDFQTDPILIRNLRTEADYFGLDRLCEMLKVTKTIQPNRVNRGLLYWLGTDKGSTDYENPFTKGAIDIGGWMDDIANKDVRFFDEANPARCRASFVEYREPLKVRYSKMTQSYVIDDSKQNIFGYCMCNYDFPSLPVVLELKAVSLRPTHVSMRAALRCDSGYNHGMCSCFWHLEGSEDGSNWDELSPPAPPPQAPPSRWVNDFDQHKLNLVHHPLNPEDDGINIVDLKLRELPIHDLTAEEVSEIMLDFMETECRETWKFDPTPTKFYRYFRIKSIPEGCFHVQGFELFGDVYEP